MYVAAHRIKDTVYVWERISPDKRIRKEYPTPYYFYVKDESGDFRSIYNEQLSKLDFDNNEDFTNAKEKFKNSGHRLYESDINPIYKVLASNYYGAELPTPNITFYDIEVDYSSKIGFSSVGNPYAPINAVSIHHYWSNRSVVYVVPPKGWDGVLEDDVRNMCEVVICKNEKELLVNLLVELENTDILSGYNSSMFDNPYVLKRIEIVLGKSGLRRFAMDRLDIPRLREVELFGQISYKVNMVGIADLDYMELIKKYDGQPRSSYKLEAMAEEFLPHLPKLTYPGTLEQLYTGVYPRMNFVETPEPSDDKLMNARVELELIQREMDQRKKHGQPSINSKLTDKSDDELASMYDAAKRRVISISFNKFTAYNYRDSEILKGFEDKMGYCKLATTMAHTSCGMLKDVFGTLVLTDLAITLYAHKNLNLIVNDWYEKPDGTIKGAYVIYPRTGMHEFIGTTDFKSLYPSVIRTINISPETIRGVFEHKEADFNSIRDQDDKHITLHLDDGTTETHHATEWPSVLISRKWAISGYGAVFDQTNLGILPAILTDWFNQRIAYQKKEKAAESGIEDVLNKYRALASKGINVQQPGYVQVDDFWMTEEDANNYNTLVTEADKYGGLSQVYKIKLNSAYGAMSNYMFRHFRLDLGESVTATGRKFLEHKARTINQALGGEYNIDIPLVEDDVEESDYDWWKSASEIKPNIYRDPSCSICAGDTDSVFFLTGANNIDDAIKIANYAAKVANASLRDFTKRSFFVQDNHLGIMSTSREIVTGKAIFVEKKRYVAHVLDKDGNRTDQIKMMGLDLKKTTIPKPVSKILTKIIEDILKGEDWKSIDHRIVDFKERLKTTEFFDIGLPKGVKKVEHYTDQYKTLGIKARLPGHVAASIHYNQALDSSKDLESMRITSNMKIKVFYLKNKRGKFTSIALPTDIDRIPSWFTDQYASDIDFAKHIDRLVDKPMGNIFKAIDRIVPTKQSLFVDDCLVF